MHAEHYRPETVIVVAVLILLFALFGSGCALTKPPVVIERKCAFAELNPKSKLPKVNLIKPSEGCPYFRCMDAENAGKLKEREILYREDSNYARRLYLETKQRCEGGD